MGTKQRRLNRMTNNEINTYPRTHYTNTQHTFSEILLKSSPSPMTHMSHMSCGVIETHVMAIERISFLQNDDVLCSIDSRIIMSFISHHAIFPSLRKTLIQLLLASLYSAQCCVF